MSFMIIFWPSFQAYFARLLLIEVNKQISHPIITLPKKNWFWGIDGACPTIALDWFDTVG